MNKDVQAVLQNKTLTGILKKVYDAGGEPALVAFIETKGKDLPAIKLTKKEMEFLKAGKSAFLWGCLAGAGAGSVLLSLCEVSVIVITT